tara:strand:- start:30068 stop:30928 length:861 start_codon:yes stop_codon:yes gene_type:complete
MSEFNPARSRANRPCPLWIDAFHRKTQHLQTDEIGAYMLILMAMWSQETCSLPDDDARLARVAKVSTRLWNSRIRDVIRPFLTSENGAVFSKRLREEAGYVERQVKQQSDRKNGKKSDKSLKDNEPDKSTDTTTDQSGEHPSQQPNNPTVSKEIDKSISHDLTEIKDAVDLYNATARDLGLSTVQKLTSARKQKLRARLKDSGGIGGWKAALDKIRGSPFLRGEETRWKADFDFLISESKFTKIMEGAYDRSNVDQNHGTRRPGANQSGFDSLLEAASNDSPGYNA